MELVSVILPAYNCQDTIQSAVESVLTQSYLNIELIIIDDGSTDKTFDLLMDIQRTDERVRLYRRDNRGLASTLNELIGLSNGDFIARMDSDDISLPNRIEEQLKYLKENLGCVMVGGQIDFIIGQTTTKAFSMPISHEDILSGLLECRFPICHPALMFRKDIALSVGCYCCNMPGEDLDFFLKMSEKGQINNIHSKVLSYRMGLSSLSVTKSELLSKAYSMARMNYYLRQRNVEELSLEQYCLIWPNLYGERYYFGLRAFSESTYRKSIYYKCSGNYFMYAFFIFISSLMRPRVAVIRLKRIVRSIFGV